MRHRAAMYLLAWGSLVDGLMGVLTFGFVRTSIAHRLMGWMLNSTWFWR